MWARADGVYGWRVARASPVDWFLMGGTSHPPATHTPSPQSRHMGGSGAFVVFLKDKDAMDSFKRGKLKLDGQASAVAVTARAALDLAYRNGVAIVTMAKGGLMYEASVGGQKFSFHAGT